MRLTPLLTTAAALLSLTLPAAHAAPAVVLELFTSQGCSSCPPADALLKKLSEADPSLVTLSFHVDYWDYLGWKDPFSSAAHTQRQQGYSHNFRDEEIYTPEMVINGQKALIGSQEFAIRKAIEQAKATPAKATVSLTPTASGQVSVTVSLTSPATTPAEVWEIRFNRVADTPVRAGENSGRTVTTINNVLSVTKLGTLGDAASQYTLAKPARESDGVAVIVQGRNLGPIVAAALL